MPIDKVFIRQIKLDASLGIEPWERSVRQTIEVDVDALVDTSLLLETGDLSAGVDYVAVIDCVREVVGGGHVDLAEKLADLIAAKILERTPAQQVCVQLRKYWPCAKAAACTGVEVVRQRQPASLQKRPNLER